MSFSKLGIAAELLDALAEYGFASPYPIQEQVIPEVLAGKDILGIAKTGSGKTASFVLPILSELKHKRASKNRHISVLVVVPTRELAAQIAEVFKMFSKKLQHPAKTLAVFGGVSVNTQMLALQNVQILVATPGRLLELIDSNAVHLAEVKTFVLDEADRMLNMGFKEEMDRIFALLPVMRQSMLFSATLSSDLQSIRQDILRNPTVVEIKQEEVDISLIEQTGYFVDESKKGPLLRYLIKEQDMQQVLVFTASVYQAENVAKKLRKNGIDANAIHSKKSQKARTDLLRWFKTGKLQVLVTTDLLSRGIDIEFLPYVINYELPRSPKDYIHRIGRTGRAESPGTAISLISPDEKHHFRVIQKKMKKWVDMIDSEHLNLQGY